VKNLPATRRPVALVLLAVATATGCRVPPDPIVVTADQISIFNATDEPWVDVDLSVNRYYRARLPRLEPGGRFDAPLRRFQGGFGRYFDPARERVREVRVTATTAAGVAVDLRWPAT
jgi:hypothetical protein